MKPKRLTSFSVCVHCCVVVSCCIASRALAADDTDKPVEAPPNHVVLSDTLDGWYFVPKELKQQYDATLGRLEALQLEIDGGQVSAKEASAELAKLKKGLQDLRTKLEASRVHVARAVMHEQTETTEFELGPEKRLAITSNHVRVIGRPGTKVKVELKKRVLSVDGKPVDDQLKAISIVQQHGRAKFAGQTDAEWEASEAEFMAKDGAKLGEQQHAERRKFVDGIRQSYAHHRDLLGKEIDQIFVAGLEYENNKVVSKSATSEGGGGVYGSVRQRYAELIVYVPPCTSVCIRGARRGLQVEDLNAALMIVDEDSTDSDARGRFEVHGLKGDLVCQNFPLHAITKVEGHVAVESTVEFGVEGAGTSHHADLRDMTPARPFAVEVRDVAGGIRLRYGRVRLDLENIRGTIDVENQFGDTHFSATAPLASAAHRIVSLSGRIDVELTPAAWESTRVLAATNHGGIRTNVSREEFDDFHLIGKDKHDNVRRNWSGFRQSIKNEDRMEVFFMFDRFAAILGDSQRANGLDLLSQNGRLVVLRK